MNLTIFFLLSVFYRSSFKETGRGKSRCITNCPAVANSILVSQDSSTLSRLSQHSSRQSKTLDTPVPKITETPVITETPPDSFQIIRPSFENQGLSKPVVDIILHS